MIRPWCFRPARRKRWAGQWKGGASLGRTTPFPLSPPSTGFRLQALLQTPHVHTPLRFLGAVKEAQCSQHVDTPGTRPCSIRGMHGYAIVPLNTSCQHRGCWRGRAPPPSRPPGNHGDGREAGATVEGLRALVSERVRASATKSYWAPPFPPPPRRSSRAPSLDPAPQFGGGEGLLPLRHSSSTNAAHPAPAC